MASACVSSHDNFHNLAWVTPLSLLPDLQPQSNDLNSDFEFRLHNNDPVTMLPADELFFDGKLVPLHFPKIPQTTKDVIEEVKSPALSPKAPKCSSRWRDFLGLKNKPQTTPNTPNKTTTKSSSSASSTIKNFLQKKSLDASLSLPLLESSFETSLSITSSRHSLSSSSCSSHEHDDLPRFSLDDKPKRVRLVRPKLVPNETPQDPKPLIDHRTRRVQVLDPSCSNRGLSIDSPRMNPAGKIVFQSLGRSSSSPSSLNGGPRYKYRGMERSYSANVRVTPVLNVPVCSSLRGSSKSGSFGFRQMFSSSSSTSTSQSQRKDKDNNKLYVHRRKESS